MKELIKSFLKEEDGLEVLEVAIITAVILIIVVVFRKQIIGMWNTVAEKLNKTSQDLESGWDVNGGN